MKIVGKSDGPKLYKELAKKLLKHGVIASLSDDYEIIDFFIADKLDAGFREFTVYNNDQYGIIVSNPDNDNYIEIANSNEARYLADFLKDNF